MTRIELEHQISAAFHSGEVRRRELRLTRDEADYLRTNCAASVVPMGEGGDKAWYEISFQGAES